MNSFDLSIHEDRLDEFEAWFDANAGATSRRDTTGFKQIPGSSAVLYTVRVTFRSAKSADLTRETWGTKGARPE